MRLPAARTTFEAAGNFRQMTDFSARLAALERLFERGERHVRAIAQRLARLEKAAGRQSGARTPVPALPQLDLMAPLAAQLVNSQRALAESCKAQLGLTLKGAPLVPVPKNPPAACLLTCCHGET